MIIVLVMLAAGLFALNYLGAQGEKQDKKVQGTQTSSEPRVQTAEDLLKEVKEHIQLPNEAPEIATISDVDLLKGQDFFKDAQNGDAVLIFQKAGRGLIYRPSTHKIIEYTKIELRSPINLP